ncbi:hypothetical protein [Sphingomonas canadensis]|uniref:hypothetical protein n=1 Tax=Sphingomonas canadensis TaxID=1219257 RepID=UPI00223299A6|nr:hypothetical protein [Sphingomonas canadensis]
MLAGPALAQTPGPKSGERADIPFIDHGGIRNFEPARDGNGVYLQDSRKNWYYASFFTRCHELPYAFAVAFKTWGPSLTRGDSVLVRGERCAIADLVRSGPPPAKPKKAKAEQPAGA